MRKFLIGTALAGVWIALVRLFPGISIFWREFFSIPLLRSLAWVGGSVPFSLLEWGFLALCAFLLASLFFKKFIRNTLRTLTVLLGAYLLIWYPLYFTLQAEYSVSDEQIAAVCEELIDIINAEAPDFSAIPDLPVKVARFPSWMQIMNISGFCSFFTGEAIISPEVPPGSLPFIAVHELMHLRGIAGEGAANIAAWEECMQRGGIYADSARIWALRCSLGVLRRENSVLYSACISRMNENTRQIFLDNGGYSKYVRAAGPMKFFYHLLGITEAAQDYEILAHYLAAQISQ